MIVISPLVEQLRVIDGTYGDKYRAVMTIEWLGVDKIFLSGLKGRMTRSEYKEFNKIMSDRGVKQIEEIRHGKRRIRRI